MPDVNVEFPPFRVLSEPELSFSPDGRNRSPHPLVGLQKHGPFSRDSLRAYLPRIRVATIGPMETRSKIRQLFGEWTKRIQPRERTAYLTEYPGFREVFGLDVVLADDPCHIELGSSAEDTIAKTDVPHHDLAQAIGDALQALIKKKDAFDVVAIYLPARWDAAYQPLLNNDFDLHDFIKASGSAAGVATQLVREDRALDYFCRCSVAWRLSIALYTKAGGIPWKLADADPGTAFIGLSYALRNDQTNKPRFVTCCSQVFDAEGTGLEFVAYDARGDSLDLENPFLSRDDMRAVMARSLRLYQERHAGGLPRRLVVHKSTPFKDEEVEGCFDAWGSVPELELVHLQEDVQWRAVWVKAPAGAGKKGSADSYPVHRGTMLPLGGMDVLLWVQGNAPGPVGGKSYFKEGKAIPRPLLLSRYAGRCTAAELCRDVLSLSKMNWNNDALYDSVPTTLAYASTLARTIKRMPKIGQNPYPFRLFM